MSPWTVRKNHNNHWGMREVIGPAVSVTGFTVATDVESAKAQCIEADCALIAAAPMLLSIARRWNAIDGGSWHVERHAQEKAELLADTRAAIDAAEGNTP